MDGKGFKTSTLYKIVVSFEIIVRPAKYNQLWPDHTDESGGHQSPKLSGSDILQGEEKNRNNSNFLVSIELKKR